MSIPTTSVRGAAQHDLASDRSAPSRMQPETSFRNELTQASAEQARPSGRGQNQSTTETARATPGNPFLPSTTSTPITPATTPTQTKATEAKSTDWCPYSGPCDSRDAIPVGGGQLTSSGAPKIVENATSGRNQYNYTGPASKNPYFTNPGNPLREGYVLGFNNWFMKSPVIVGPNAKTTSANSTYYATEEGAQEALRLVRMYEPGAELARKTWGGGPFVANQPTFVITLPNGRELNAGNVLDGYYNGGYGVTIRADMELEQAVRLA